MLSVTGACISTNTDLTLFEPEVSLVALDPMTLDLYGKVLVEDDDVPGPASTTVPSKYLSRSSLYFSSLYSAPNKTATGPAGNWNTSGLLAL